MNEKTGAGYIRVSTDKQEELSPDAQKRLIIDYATDHNINLLPEHIFIDNGISGRKADKRPEFQKMIGMAKSKEHPFDVIIVWKYSRFARNQEESIVYKSLLKKNDVDVLSVSEPLVDGPFGSLIERIIEWMDEYYSIRLSGEVMRGMTEKAMRGGIQATVPLGYDQGEVPTINSDAALVRTIYAKYMTEHMSFREIAKWLNACGYKTKRGNNFEERAVKYILTNPFYCGLVRWNVLDHSNHQVKDKSEWIIARGQHEPLFSEKYWNDVQEQIAARKRPQKAHSSTGIKHWLSGIVQCDCCHSNLMYQSANKGFQCGNYLRGSCNTSHFISANKLEQSVMDTLRALSAADMLSYSLRCDNTSDDDMGMLLKAQLDKLTAKEKRIKLAYSEGIDTIDEYRSNKAAIEQERKALKKQIAELNKASDDVEVLRNKIGDVYQLLLDVNDNKIKADVLRSVVDNFVYNKNNDTLTVNLYLTKSLQ